MNKNYKIYNYCELRWDYYEERDRGYYPSKHDPLVLKEAADKFDITVEEAEKAFNTIAKIKANLEVMGLTKEEKMNKLVEIIENNRETPWGKEKK